MGKHKSIEVFTLVQSLKPAEKRYFKQLFAHRSQGEKKYILLFDALMQLATYNEADILRLVPSISAVQLPNLKAHLYNRILQGLRNYYQASSSDLQIRELLDGVRLLYERGLYQLCNNSLQKAKKLASKYEQFALQLETLQWEQNLLPHISTKGYQQKAQQLAKEAKEITQRINDINELNLLHLEFQALYLEIGFMRNRQDFAKVTRLVKPYLPKNEKHTLADFERYSVSEKIALFRLYVGYYHFTQQYEHSYVFANAWVELLEQNQEWIVIKINVYISALNYLMNAQERIFDYKSLQMTRKKLRQLWKSPPVPLQEHNQNKLFKYIYVHEFNRLFMLGDFAKGVQLMQKIKKDLEWFISTLNPHSQIILYYKIACLYFGNENYSEALVWLNKIINFPQNTLREDIHNFARILYLVSHYELENTDVLDYYIRATYRYLLKTNNYQQFQKYIIAFLKKLSNTTENSLQQAFEELYQQLLPLAQHPYEKRAFIYFDILSWLQAKIQQRPVSEVIREKALKKLI